MGYHDKTATKLGEEVVSGVIDDQGKLVDMECYRDNFLKIEKKEKLARLQKKLITFIFRLKDMKIQVQDMMNYPVFPTEAYALPKSRKMLRQVNLNNIIEVKKLLDKNRYLVFQIDAVGKTALHRASVKGDLRMVKLILDYLPDVNKQDCMGFTPLTYAVKNDYFDVAKVRYSL